MRTKAIILKKIPAREYDELAVCYTEDAGKQVYQAKSVLRPTSKQAGHLDILNLVDFSLVHGNGTPIITSAYCLKAFSNLKSSLPALAAANFLLECFDKLVFEGEQDGKLWDFLVSELGHLDKLAADKHTDWALAIALAKADLLKVLGYAADSSLEELANSRFRSLQFARKVIR